ncbi:VCBS domain-containing protein [Oceanicoccus sagamiensis]|uniref:Cadherin domain-containing protein n=1 Tax=Oceanicoccus sagamiensis TaxID=716816 RepID=A0A1X9NK86_9GAMM|nr:VCBS domain-containing protein [Oceanicoccus sagamiensis]ARN74373.1 hypothetical protein BST96_09710 [Oceanicoccus sagamiensis]
MSDRKDKTPPGKNTTDKQQDKKGKSKKLKSAVENRKLDEGGQAYDESVIGRAAGNDFSIADLPSENSVQDSAKQSMAAVEEASEAADNKTVESEAAVIPDESAASTNSVSIPSPSSHVVTPSTLTTDTTNTIPDAVTPPGMGVNQPAVGAIVEPAQQTTSGSQQPPEIYLRGDHAGLVVEDNKVGQLASGKMTELGGTGQFVAEVDQGNYGRFSIDKNGNWQYQLDNKLPATDHLATGETVTEVFHIVTPEGLTQDIQITVQGHNDAPTIDQIHQQQTFEDGALLNGKITATDVDHGDHCSFSTASNIEGFRLNPDGSYQFNPSSAAYQHLAAGETQLLSIPVTVTDQQGATDTQLLQITVTGTNDKPTLAVNPGTYTTGQLEVTDIDTLDTHRFSVTAAAGQFGSLMVDPDTGRYSYTQNPSVAGMFLDKTTGVYRGTDTFEVKVTDPQGGEATQFISFAATATVSAPNSTHPLTPVITPMVATHPVVATTAPLTTGNAPTTPSNSVTIDLVASSDSGRSSTDNLTNQQTPTLTGQTAIAFSVVEIIDAGKVVATTTSDGQGHYSVTTQALAESSQSHQLTAQATAPSATTQVSSSGLAVTIDTHAEASISVAPVTSDNIINAAESGGPVMVSGSVGGDVVDGDVITLTVNGKQFTGTAQGGQYQIAVDGIALTADQHIIATVTSTDAAGNQKTAMLDHSYSVDTQATATVALQESSGDQVISATEAGSVGVLGQVEVGSTIDSLTVTDGQQTITIPTGAYQLDPVTGKFQITTDLSTLQDGQLSVELKGHDSAGNPFDQSNTMAKDTLASATVTVAPVTPDNIINAAESGSQVMVRGSTGGDVVDGDIVTLSVNGQSFTGVVKGSVYSIAVDGAALKADSHIVAEVTTSDKAGNLATATADHSYAVDTQTTATVAITDAGGDGVINAAEASRTIISGDIEPGASLEQLQVVDSQGKAFNISPSLIVIDGNGHWQFPIDAGTLADGKINVLSYSRDAAGNTATATAAIDKDSVTTARIALHDGNVGDKDDVLNAAEAKSSVVMGKVEAGSSIDSLVVTDGTNSITLAPNSFKVDASGRFHLITDLSPLQDGTLTIELKGQDRAGNPFDQTDSMEKDTVANAVDDKSTATEDQGPAATSGNVLNNDEQGASLTSSGDIAGLYGTYHFHSDGSYTYELDNSKVQSLAEGAKLEDHAQYTITDAAGNDNTATLKTVITGTNDLPVIAGVVNGAVIEAGSNTVGVDTASGQLVATDADTGDSLHWHVAQSQGIYGSLTMDQQGQWTYQLDNAAGSAASQMAAGEQRQDFFWVTATDGSGIAVPQKIAVDITGANDKAIIADAQTDATKISITEDRGYINTHYQLEYHGRLTISDPDAGEAQFDPNIGPQTYQGIGYDSSLGGHVLLMRGGGYTYYIDQRQSVVQNLGAGEHITDHATIKSVDGTEHIISVVINGTNDAPTVSAAPTLTPGTEDKDYTLHSSDLLSNASDIDHNDQGQLSVHQLEALKPDGSVAGTMVDNHNGTYTFQPEQNYNGPVQFHYHIQDAHGGSVSTSASLTLAAVQDRAVISGVDTGSVTEASYQDRSPDYAQPGISKLGQNALSVDGKLDITDADQGEAVFDTKGGTFTSYSGQYGHLLLNADGNWHYMVTVGSSDYVGNRISSVGSTIDQLGEGQSLTDTITVYSKDGTSHDIVITIHGDNDRPYCSSAVQLASGKEDTAQTLTVAELLKNTVDVDANDANQLSIGNMQVDHGSVTHNTDGTLTFTPEKDYNGQVNFTYDVKDAHGGVTQTGASLNLSAVGDAAIITSGPKQTITEDASGGNSEIASGSLTIVDPDAGEQRFQYSQFGEHAIHDPFGGQLRIDNAGTWGYTVPNSALQHLAAGQVEQVSYLVHSQDGTAHTINIEVVGSHDRPTATAQVINGVEDTSHHFTAAEFGFSDVDDGDTLQHITITQLPTATDGALFLNGQAVSAGQQIAAKDIPDLVFTPAANINGDIDFNYTTNDGHADSAVATAHLQIAAVGDAATITGDSSTAVTEDLNINRGFLIGQGLLHSQDVDNTADTFQVETLTQKVDGSASVGTLRMTQHGHWIYTVENNAVQHLAKGETLTETFTVHSEDGTAHTVSVDVIGTNDQPTLTINTTTPVTGDLVGADIDGDALQYDAIQPSGHYGHLTVDASGHYHYQQGSSVAGMNYDASTGTYSAKDVYEVRVSDGQGGETRQFLTFDITATVNAPAITGGQPVISAQVPTLPSVTSTQPTAATIQTTPPQNAVTLDLEAGSDTGQSTTDNYTKASTPTLSGHTDIPFSQVDIYSGNQLLGSTRSNASGQFQLVSAQLTDGVYPLTAQATAPSATAAVSSSPLSITVDTQVAPLAINLTHDTGSSATDLLTNDGALTITGQESGASLEYSIDGGKNWSNHFTPVTGANTVAVRQVDIAGNMSSPATLDFTLDNQVAAPTVSLRNDTSRTFNAAADGITKDPRLSIQSEAGARLEYSTDSGQHWSNGFTASEGANTFLVRQTDIAGNQSAATHFSFTLDTTPGTVTVDPISTDNALNAAENNQPLVITGTTSNTAPGDEVYIKIGSNNFYGAQVDANGHWQLTLNASEHQKILGSDKDYPITVGTIDAAGNATTEIVTHLLVDTANPLPVISVDPITTDNIINLAESQQTIDITGQASGDFNSGDPVSLTINGQTLASYSGQVDATGHYQIAVPASVLLNQTGGATGYTVEASIITKDSVGNLGSASSGNRNFSVDTTINPLQVSLTHDTGIAGDHITSDGGLTLGGQEPGALIEYSTDGGTHWSQQFTPQAGTNSVSVRQTDAAGNSSSPTAISFTLDNTVAAPQISLNTDSGSNHSDLISNKGVLNVAGVETGSTLEISTDGGQHWQSTFTAVEGVNNVLARQTDVAGNVSATSALNFTLDTQIDVSIYSSSVQANGDLKVDIFLPKDSVVDQLQISSGGVVLDVDLTKNLLVANSTLTPDHHYFTFVDIDLSSLPDGPLTISATAQDKAGNTASTQNNFGNQLVLDTQAQTQDDMARVIEDQTQPALGNVLSNDEAGSVVTSVGDIAGSYGVFHLQADGSYSYQLNNADPAVDALSPGSTPLVDRVSYTTQDAAGNVGQANLIIAITGSNDAPVISHPSFASTNEDTDYHLKVSDFNFTDVDGDSLHHITITELPTAEQGVLTMGGQAVHAGQSIAAADIPKLVFSPTQDFDKIGGYKFTVSDGHTDSAEKMNFIGVHAINDAPVINAASDLTGRVDEDAAINTVAGQMAMTDVDTASGHTWSVSTDPSHAAHYGTMTVDNTGAWHYALDNSNPAVNQLGHADVLTDNVMLLVDDGHGGVAEKEVVISIYGNDDRPPIPVAPTWKVPPTITGSHGNQNAQGSLGVPPMVIQGVPTPMTGWGISTGHGSVTSLQGHYGTLTINPATGELHYDYRTQSGVIKQGGGGGVDQDVTDVFTVTLGGSNNELAEVHLHVQSQSVHGNSGHHVDKTQLINMELLPLAPAQSDELEPDVEESSVTLQLQDDPTGQHSAVDDYLDVFQQAGAELADQQPNTDDDAASADNPLTALLDSGAVIDDTGGADNGLDPSALDVVLDDNDPSQDNDQPLQPIADIVDEQPLIPLDDNPPLPDDDPSQQGI